jgi:hypothetical protein
MKHQEGSFAMQHHSQLPAKGNQHPAKGSNAGTTGYLVSHETISSETIERHIAEGKRLQAEAIAAFVRGAFSRVAAAFQRAPAQASDTAGNGAVPHRA